MDVVVAVPAAGDAPADSPGVAVVVDAGCCW